MVKRDLNAYQEYFSGYTELRTQENRTEIITLVDGDIMGNNQSSTSGVSTRVFKNGCWGFASNADYQSDAVKKVISSATENAGFMSTRMQKGSINLPSFPGNLEIDFSTKKNKASQKEKIGFIKELDSYIVKNCKGISSRTLAMRNLDMEKNLITSDGSSSYSLIPRALIYIILTMDKDGEPVEIFTPIGGRGQFEDQFSSPEEYFEKIDTFYNHLKNKSEAVYSDAGYKDCILDADLAGSTGP